MQYVICHKLAQTLTECQSNVFSGNKTVPHLHNTYVVFKSMFLQVSGYVCPSEKHRDSSAQYTAMGII